MGEDPPAGSRAKQTIGAACLLVLLWIGGGAAERRSGGAAEEFDDDLLRQAEENIQDQWDRGENPNAPEYDLFDHNCQDYADAVEGEYERLEQEREQADTDGTDETGKEK